MLSRNFFVDTDGLSEAQCAELSKIYSVLDALYESRQRVIFTMGYTILNIHADDIANGAVVGEVWRECVQERIGRIGRSTGEHKIPLLIKTIRSTGGIAISVRSVLCITESRSSTAGEQTYPVLYEYKP